MIIGKHEIKVGNAPFIVAEIGAAHNGLLDRALSLMEAAKRAGAHAVKLQAFTPDTITFPGTRPEFTIPNGPWMGRTLHDLYDECQTPRVWFPALFERARDLDIVLFASVFSRDDLAWMERLGCPAYKIASPEIVDLDLIGAVAATKKPVIISTGMASRDDIIGALYAFEGAGGVTTENVAFLHCVSDYPTPIEGAGLLVLKDLIQIMGIIPVGLSDHTIGSEAAMLATGFGACIIEKHITLSRDGGGPDDGFASTPEEFTAMCRAVQRAHSALKFESSIGEHAHSVLRRSLYVVKDVKAGERFTRNNVRSIRPDSGLPVKQLPAILDKIAKFDVRAGTPMSLDFVEGL